MKTLTKKRLIQINDNLWSLIVRTRDDFTCKMCGTQTKHSEAHHIIGKDNKVVRWVLINGITLCYYHHRFWMHGGKMTDEKRIEFYESFLCLKQGKMLGDDYDELKRKANQVVKFNLDFCKLEFVRLMNYCVDMNIDTSKIVPRYIVKELLPEWYPTKEMLKNY